MKQRSIDWRRADLFRSSLSDRCLKSVRGFRLYRLGHSPLIAPAKERVVCILEPWVEGGRGGFQSKAGKGIIGQLCVGLRFSIALPCVGKEKNRLCVLLVKEEEKRS